MHAKWFAAFAVAGVWFVSWAYAESPSSPQLQAIYAAYFSTLHEIRSLHSYDKSPVDGAKGYEIYTPVGQYFDVAGHAPYDSEDDAQLHAWYCHSDAIVFATNVSSQSYLGGNESTIFTDSTFVVDEVIKGQPGTIRTGFPVDVVRIGGTVEDGADTLKVMVANRPDFEKGKEYFLLLNRPNQPLFQAWHTSDWITVEVAADRFHTSKKSAFGIMPGESPEALRSRIDWLAHRFACH